MKYIPDIINYMFGIDDEIYNKNTLNFLLKSKINYY